MPAKEVEARWHHADAFAPAHHGFDDQGHHWWGDRVAQRRGGELQVAVADRAVALFTDRRETPRERKAHAQLQAVAIQHHRVGEGRRVVGVRVVHVVVPWWVEAAGEHGRDGLVLRPHAGELLPAAVRVEVQHARHAVLHRRAVNRVASQHVHLRHQVRDEVARAVREYEDERPSSHQRDGRVLRVEDDRHHLQARLLQPWELLAPHLVLEKLRHVLDDGAERARGQDDLDDAADVQHAFLVATVAPSPCLEPRPGERLAARAVEMDGVRAPLHVGVAAHRRLGGVGKVREAFVLLALAQPAHAHESNHLVSVVDVSHLSGHQLAGTGEAEKTIVVLAVRQV